MRELSKIAFIFPGQGAQYIGMGREIACKYPASEEIFKKASNALNYDIEEMIFEGDEETLKITENTQPAILTASISGMQPLLEAGIIPYCTAGLSLGEYSAHVAAGTILFEDAVKLVRKRGSFMQEAVPVGEGATAAIIGLDSQAVIDACDEASVSGIVAPANFNCPGQVVVSGETEAVQMLTEICLKKGAKRALILPVSAPFHCGLLRPAGEKLSKELEKIDFHEMQIPVIANVNAKAITDKNEAKELLVKQVSNSVLWEESIRTMVNMGIDTFIEIGPGKVLSGFVKRTVKEARALNVENIASLETTLNELKNIN